MMINVILRFLHTIYGQMDPNITATLVTPNDIHSRNMVRIVSLPRVPLKCVHFANSGESCLTDNPFPSTQWYFDPFSQRCRTFSFRGCGGSINRFATKTDCIRACGCFGSLNIGNVPCGKGGELRFAFDQTSSRCKEFAFSQCGGGNDNNFQSLTECKNVCGLEKNDFQVHKMIRGSSAVVQDGRRQSTMITGTSALSRAANMEVQPRRVGVSI